MLKIYLVVVLCFILGSCASQDEDLVGNENGDAIENDSLIVESYYEDNNKNELPSECSGTVSNGKLKNGRIMPFYGNNFSYFDQESYLGGRAFTSDKVKTTILNAYDDLNTEIPGRQFYLMELSNKNGGKLFPHRTHQNGQSVDFMMPKLKDDLPNIELDTLGKAHYWLEFNDNGEYSEDKSIKVDFNLIARHILILNERANEQGLKISKVIIKIEYKDELFSTQFGKELKDSGIYIVKALSPLINALHDDHYHIDFVDI